MRREGSAQGRHGNNFLRQQTWFLFANCSQPQVAIVFILSFPSFYRVSWGEQLKDAGRPSHNCTGADDNDDDDGDDNDDNDDHHHHGRADHDDVNGNDDNESFQKPGAGLLIATALLSRASGQVGLTLIVMMMMADNYFGGDDVDDCNEKLI